MERGGLKWETKSLIQAPVSSRGREGGEEQESELIVCGDPKHACIFDKWPREMPNRELTACTHSTSAKSLQGGSIKRIDRAAVAHVSGIPEISWAAAPTHCYSSLVLISIYSKQGQSGQVRSNHYAQIPAVPLGTQRGEGDTRTWFISSNLCLCCSFRSPNAFPPRK